jgi:RNA polymerase sigma-70 factor (ECF subfamily)
VAILRTPLLPAHVAEARPVLVDEADPAARGRALLTELYARHAPSIHRFLRDLLEDHALASDATQETFCRAFRRLDAMPDPSRVAPWLFTIARNVSLEVRKARFRARRIFVPQVDGADAPADARRSPEGDLLDQESLRVASAALARLGPDRRAALLLRLDHGLTYEDIATAMGWSLAKVKVEIFRARQVLRATLEEYRNGGAR